MASSASQAPSATARPRATKHRVSFSGDQPRIIDSSTSTAASTSSMATAPTKKERRSSLKSQARPAVPKHLYQHKDPLLRRLRLRDPYGRGVDLKREFRDTDVVGFLFGSSWSQGKVEAFYKDIVTFTRRHPHRFKCIYCSVDTDEAAYKQNTESRPWLAMEWADGSNLPVASYEDAAEPVVGSLANGEDFLLAGEEDTEATFVMDDEAGDAYTRPFARVHLARYFDVWSVPTLVVYHLPSRTVLTRRVRPAQLEKAKADAIWAKWEAGQSSDLTPAEVLVAIRWPLTFLVLSIIYAVSVFSGGPNYLQQLLISVYDATHGIAAAPPAPKVEL